MKTQKLKNVIRGLVASAATASLLVGAEAAYAQAMESQQSGLGDIIVTAQRRTESVQKVPISIQVFTPEALERERILDTRDLATISPSVNYASSALLGNSTFVLRGIASAATSPGLQPSVAMVIDGVPVYNQGEFISGLGDIERIEVLNGPQGTLFGKNSTAGVINIVTKQPVDRFEGELEGSVTSDEEVYLRGLVNLPLTEKARLRLNAFYRDRAPLVENLAGEDIHAIQAHGVNAKLAVDLSEDATFTLAGTYSFADSSESQYVLIGPSTLNAAAQLLNPPPPFGYGVAKASVNTIATDTVKTINVMGTLEWQLADDLTLTSISNYTRFREAVVIDGDGTPAGSNIGIGEAIPGSTYFFQALQHGADRKNQYDYHSQEVRINYKYGPVDAVFGGFYQHVSVFHTEQDRVRLGDNFFLPQPFAWIKNNTYSVFGDVTYELTDQFKVFGGLRYTHEKISEVYHRDIYSGLYSQYDPVTGIFSGPPPATIDAADKESLNNLSGRVGIQFQPTSTMNFYASAAKGYKGPAANTSAAQPAGEDILLDPEKATAFEIGAKMRLFDNRLSINAALFHEVIKGIQATTLDPSSPVIVTRFLNAGKLKTRGFEGEAIWAVTPALRLNGSLAYVKGTYDDLLIGCNIAQTMTGTCPNFEGRVGVQDGTGLPAIRAPKWKYSVGGSYEDDVGRDVRFYARASWTWNSSVQYSLDNNPFTREPGYGTLNMSLGLKDSDDRWEVQVFGRNLNNDFYYTGRVYAGIVGTPVGYLPRDFKRYVGIKLITRM